MLPAMHVELIERLVSDANTVLLYSALNAGPGPWRNGAWGSGVGFLWSAVWLLLLVTLVGAVAYFVSSRTTDTNSDRALAVLRERYARGEIEKEDFEERASRLEDAPASR